MALGGLLVLRLGMRVINKRIGNTGMLGCIGPDMLGFLGLIAFCLRRG